MFRHRLSLVAAILLLATAAPALAQNTLSFTVSTAFNPDGSVTPTLTWSTTPAATGCTAAQDWTGAKAASGSQTLSPISSSKTYNLSCDFPGTPSLVTFQWVPATQNDNGSTYTDPNLTRIKYTFGATAPTATTACAPPTVVCVDVDDKTTPRPTVKTVSGLVGPPGTLKAIAQHINLAGISSAASNAATKIYTAPVSVGQTVNVSFPGAPSGFGAT